MEERLPDLLLQRPISRLTPTGCEIPPARAAQVASGDGIPEQIETTIGTSAIHS